MRLTSLLVTFVSLLASASAFAEPCVKIFQDFTSSQSKTEKGEAMPLPDGGVVAGFEDVDGSVRILIIHSPEIAGQINPKNLKPVESGACTLPNGQEWRYLKSATKKPSRKPASKSEERQLPKSEL